jgi:hypothetical protein
MRLTEAQMKRARRMKKQIPIKISFKDTVEVYYVDKNIAKAVSTLLQSRRKD